MKKYDEAYNTLGKCFEEMEALTAIISNRLRQSDMPVRALFVEYWPTFLSNQVMYKVWNGIEHLMPIKGHREVPSMVSAGDILEIVKHREILYRKF